MLESSISILKMKKYYYYSLSSLMILFVESMQFKMILESSFHFPNSLIKNTTKTIRSYMSSLESHLNYQNCEAKYLGHTNGRVNLNTLI